MGFSVSGAGGVSVTATINQSVNASNNTGINLASGTYLMLARYTKGSGTSPSAANWTLDSGNGEVKWGRNGNTLTSITAQPSQQGRIDEIRVTTEFSELNLASATVVIPEPSTALLGGLGFLVLLRRRR